MKILIWIVAIAAALYGLHRLGLWMESKDWIYYRRKRKPDGDVALGFGSIFDPGVRHMIQAKYEIVAENEDDGDDDDDRPEEDRVATKGPPHGAPD